MQFDGKKLKALREAVGMTQTDLGVELYRRGACQVPTARQSVAVWESDDGGAPSSKVVATLCLIFDVTAPGLFTDPQGVAKP